MGTKTKTLKAGGGEKREKSRESEKREKLSKKSPPSQSQLLSFRLDSKTIQVAQELISILWKEKKDENDNGNSNLEAEQSGSNSDSESDSNSKSNSSSDSATELSDEEISDLSSISVVSRSRSLISVDEKPKEKKRKIKGISILMTVEFLACVMYTFQGLVLWSAGVGVGEAFGSFITLALLWASFATTRGIDKPESYALSKLLYVKLLVLLIQLVFMPLSIILGGSLAFAFLQIPYLLFYISFYGFLGGALALCRYKYKSKAKAIVKAKAKAKGQGQVLSVKFSIDLKELNTPPPRQEKDEAASGEDDEESGENSV